MSIKSILVPFSGTKEEMPALTTAYSIAHAYASAIKTMYIYPEINSGMLRTKYETAEMEAEHNEHYTKAQQYFDSFIAEHQIPIITDTEAATGISASFQVARDSFTHAVSYHGKLADLIIIDRAIQEFGECSKQPILSAIMKTGKGMLLLPPDKPFVLGDSVTIAWNGSLQAARAVTYALPILCNASKVTIITCGGVKENSPDAEELSNYLKLHAITAEVVDVPEQRLSTELTLIMKALESGSRLIVMGAFTHHKLKEVILGGVTNFMLEENEIPVFMAH